MSDRFCTQCGYKVKLGDRYCLQCGAEVPSLEKSETSHDGDGESAAPTDRAPESESVVRENGLDSDTEPRGFARNVESEARLGSSSEKQNRSGEHPDWMRSTETAGHWSRWLLRGLAALAGFWFLVDFMGWELAFTAAQGDFVSQSDADFVDGAVQSLSILWLLGYVATVIAFLVWFRKAHNNLERLGLQGVEYSANWAVGSFFVPILNLFRPYQIARQIAKGSAGEASGSEAWKDQPTPRIVKWWWGLFLFSNYLSWLVSQADMSGSLGVEDMGGYFALDALSNLFLCVAAIVAAKMIAFVTDQQKRSSRAVM